MQYRIPYYICNVWYLMFQYCGTLFIIYFILRRIPVLDDSIGLKKELTVIAYLLFLQVVLGIFFRVIDPNIISIDDDLQKYQPILNQIVVLLMRFSRFGINYMQTRWVVNTFDIIRRHESNVDGTDPTAITLSTRTMRNIVHEKTLRLIDDPKDSLYLDERARMMQMKQVYPSCMIAILKDE